MLKGAMAPTCTARVRPRGASLAALSASALLVAACATGEVSPFLVDGTGDGADAAAGGGADGDASNGGYQTIDSGKGGDDAGYTVPTPDASTPDTSAPVDGAPPVDSAPPPVDSAPPPPPPTGDCTGTTSTQLAETYDSACDAYFVNSFGGGNPCTPGANGCAAMNGQGGIAAFCCYKPPSGTNCYLDYGGQAQCIPK